MTEAWEIVIVMAILSAGWALGCVIYDAYCDMRDNGGENNDGQ